MTEPCPAPSTVPQEVIKMVKIMQKADAYCPDADEHQSFAQRMLDCECCDEDCQACSVRDCPYDEPLHYHHDGCPACYNRHIASHPSITPVFGEHAR